MSSQFVDADVFLGMHSPDEDTRIACKNLFVHHFEDGLRMLLEDVGICDDVLWNESREVQDAYYPFMDVLHSTMPIQRMTFSESAFAALEDVPRELTWHERLSLATLEGEDAKLYTLSTEMRNASPRAISVDTFRGDERSFPEGLEGLYQTSLVFRTKK